MRYFNRFTILLFTLLLLLLSACSSFVKKEKAGEAEAQLESGADTELFVALPNPYLGGDVPEPAKREFANIKNLMAAKNGNKPKVYWN